VIRGLGLGFRIRLWVRVYFETVYRKKLEMHWEKWEKYSKN
jgi:hypothetical protein